ncbi:HRAS-like suppressor 3, partial [Notothenia coriiceps]|uniref:HRAS-like suppressor 3 n=1 Tax=Notothenia coriiceps TaxID=8208 RepID=A0A6I9N779_9TELE
NILQYLVHKPNNHIYFPLFSFVLIANVQGASADSLMSVPNEKALVKKEKLRDVVGNDKWEINNSLDEKNKPRPAKDIARDACARVGQTLPYNVIKKNCEHFANDLRYGKAKSMQVG